MEGVFDGLGVLAKVVGCLAFFVLVVVAILGILAGKYLF